ncbi:MAG TPA: polysaccharide deacetylase, partial [Pseudogracilibacillus sp.]|nr:polysaccharide deacetylase [Pseudogracilibacillus sp.]
MRLKYIKVIVILLLANFFIGSTAYSYGWGFKSSEGEQRPDIGKYEKLIENRFAYYAELTNEKNIYLTFDNG